MQCFLKDADTKQDEQETIHNLVTEIREVAYNAEAVFEPFVFEVASRRRGGGFRNILIRSVIILNEVLAATRFALRLKLLKAISLYSSQAYKVMA
ncbi:putative disease resistance protein [Camellia lanceoleosa]|uniref:Disease resistance protein n=1 Tax=Camellia lanceoleosa TaxID=1840588 RepID=A0ACC0HBS0_9ERIC|nr:putative disease resistance protein [Camellia lanceoleosa]